MDSPIPIEVLTPQMEKPVEAKDFKAQSTLELQRTTLPNPCRNGCGYYFGQCVRGVALWREQLGIPVGSDWGNASEWLRMAQAANVPTGKEPQLNAIVSFPTSQVGDLGHVALVIGISPVGGFRIRELNWAGLNVMTERELVNHGEYNFIYE